LSGAVCVERCLYSSVWGCVRKCTIYHDPEVYIERSSYCFNKYYVTITKWLYTKISKANRRPDSSILCGQLTRIGYDTLYTSIFALMTRCNHLRLSHPNRSYIYQQCESQCPYRTLLLNNKGARPYKRNFYSGGRTIVTDSRQTFDAIVSWISRCNAFDKKFQRKFKEGGLSAFSSRFMDDINALIFSYNYLVSKEIEISYLKVEKRITFNNLSKNLNKIQCVFIESFSIRVYMIYKIKSSSGSLSPGLDGICFTTISTAKKLWEGQQLSKTRYGMSTKSAKIKKDRPARAIVSSVVFTMLLGQVKMHNGEVINTLIKLCDLKTLNKNYKASLVKKVWIPKNSKGEFRSLGLPSLKDRVLQRIITDSVHPIVEFQADRHSFGFRRKRSAVDAIAFISSSLTYLGETREVNDTLPRKITKEMYGGWPGKKCRVRINKKLWGESKRRRSYKYIYWGVKESANSVNSSFSCYSNNKFINVGIDACLDKIPHESMLDLYPLTKKYTFLLKAWLVAPILGSESGNSAKLLKIIPVAGVPQGSIIGPSLCNVVLDGLENYLFQGLRKHYKLTAEETTLLKTKNEYKFITPISYSPTNIRCIRFVDAILIFGKGPHSQFIKIYELLVDFLSKRALSLKITKEAKIIQEFKRGSSFEYLDFKFVYLNTWSEDFFRSKYGGYPRNPIDILRKSKVSNRGGLIVLIKPKPWDDCKQKIKNLLCKSNTPMPVSVLITKTNEILKRLVWYFGITKTTRWQLKFLDHLVYKRFKKILQWKFGSKPKLRSFLRKTYYTDDNRVKVGSLVISTTRDFMFFGNKPIYILSSLENRLKANIYLDSKIFR